ncbi:hypothetical protein C8J56DRAFT_1027011 [Mycena floridula]|nr:hypothetical protein C8J56DRAFT_1027011 [Mycena floridula]
MRYGSSRADGCLTGTYEERSSHIYKVLMGCLLSPFLDLAIAIVWNTCEGLECLEGFWVLELSQTLPKKPLPTTLAVSPTAATPWDNSQHCNGFDHIRGLKYLPSGSQPLTHEQEPEQWKQETKKFLAHHFGEENASEFLKYVSPTLATGHQVSVKELASRRRCLGPSALHQVSQKSEAERKPNVSDKGNLCELLSGRASQFKQSDTHEARRNIFPSPEPTLLRKPRVKPVLKTAQDGLQRRKVQHCIKTPGSYPLTCCGKPLRKVVVQWLIRDSPGLAFLFCKKIQEWNTPPEYRIYCSNRGCKIFIQQRRFDGEDRNPLVTAIRSGPMDRVI